MRLAASEDFRDRFRAKVCASKTPEECEAAFHRLIDAEMARRFSPPTLQRSRERATCIRDDVTIENAREADHAAAAARTASAIVETTAVLTGATVCHSYPSAFGGEATISGVERAHAVGTVKCFANGR